MSHSLLSQSKPAPASRYSQTSLQSLARPQLKRVHGYTFEKESIKPVQSSILTPAQLPIKKEIAKKSVTEPSNPTKKTSSFKTLIQQNLFQAFKIDIPVSILQECSNENSKSSYSKSSSGKSSVSSFGKKSPASRKSSRKSNNKKEIVRSDQPLLVQRPLDSNTINRKRSFSDTNYSTQYNSKAITNVMTQLEHKSRLRTASTDFDELTAAIPADKMSTQDTINYDDDNLEFEDQPQKKIHSESNSNESTGAKSNVSKDYHLQEIACNLNLQYSSINIYSNIQASYTTLDLTYHGIESALAKTPVQQESIEETYTFSEQYDEEECHAIEEEEDEDDVSLGCDEIVEPEPLKTKPSASSSASSSFNNKDHLPEGFLQINLQPIQELPEDSEAVQAQIEAWETNFNIKAISFEKDPDFLRFMYNNEGLYRPNPNCLAENQNEVTVSMRAILVDWLTEVCEDFGFKRVTYHLAINYLDRYLSLVKNVPTEKLQGVGITCLFLAAKMEEVQVPKIKDFAKATDDTYNAKELLEIELELCNVFKWRLHPTSFYTAANTLMSWWDDFMRNSIKAALSAEIESSSTVDDGIYFKNATATSYKIFREVAQIIDLAQLNLQYTAYKPSELATSLLYLCLGKAFGQFTAKEIVDEGCRALQDKDLNDFNKIFEDFLKECQGPALHSLLPCIEFLSTFFGAPLCTKPPKCIKNNTNKDFQGNYEDFLSYQTFSQGENLDFYLAIINKSQDE